MQVKKSGFNIGNCDGRSFEYHNRKLAPLRSISRIPCPSGTREDMTIRWFIALSLAASQIGIPIFAVYSSSHNRFSEGARIGGIFGILGNLSILAVIAGCEIILTVKSFMVSEWHDGQKPLCTVALSSTIAIATALNPALGCTVLFVSMAFRRMSAKFRDL